MCLFTRRRIVILYNVLTEGGTYAEPVTRWSFHQARQRFLGLLQNPPQQQTSLEDDDNMLVPDGELAFYMFYVSCVFVVQGLLIMLHNDLHRVQSQNLLIVFPNFV